MLAFETGIHDTIGIDLVIKGIVDGCKQSDCALLGGERCLVYTKKVPDIVSKGGEKGIAHITGGGFTDNIPRVFPEGFGASICKDSWEMPAVFKWLQEAGKIEDSEMMRTFNMGIGIVLVVTPEAANRILENGSDTDKAYRIGEVISGKGVTYC
ncbi:putative phosphoribosylformylglycinamidine cyclo-ligase [Medicago truncatula]|nr:putative phosphoribosylformylglycinamidine cyclo-ligase [Medicago truncatula]